MPRAAYMSPEHRKKFSERKKAMWAAPGFKEWYFTTVRPRKTRVRAGGYWRVRVPGHPRADVNGYVIEQRLVMEGHLQRPLLDHEIVHHINHDKYDNRIENLQITTHSEHAKLHHRHFVAPHTFPRKLTDEQVAEIRRLYDGRYGSQTRLSKQFGVSQATIFDIVSYRKRTLEAASTNNTPVSRRYRRPSKLDLQTIQAIQRRYQTEQVSQAKLAEEYHISQASISKLVRNHRRGFTTVPSNPHSAMSLSHRH